jgi:hypothetical protein
MSDADIRAFGTSVARNSLSPIGVNVHTSRSRSRAECVRTAVVQELGRSGKTEIEQRDGNERTFHDHYLVVDDSNCESTLFHHF